MHISTLFSNLIQNDWTNVYKHTRFTMHARIACIKSHSKKATELSKVNNCGTYDVGSGIVSYFVGGPNYDSLLPSGPSAHWVQGLRGKTHYGTGLKLECPLGLGTALQHLVQ